ncbi:MAG: hypothetical protein IPO08_21830 [Xanthomonadales bacterium]|nr:hypothetical protein [Xanthomonadales bacterium]
MDPAAPVAVSPPADKTPEAPAPPVVELRRGAPTLADFSDLERATREEAATLAGRLDRLERQRDTHSPAKAEPPPATPAAAPAGVAGPWRIVGAVVVLALVVLAVIRWRRSQVAR